MIYFLKNINIEIRNKWSLPSKNNMFYQNGKSTRQILKLLPYFITKILPSN